MLSDLKGSKPNKMRMKRDGQSGVWITQLSQLIGYISYQPGHGLLAITVWEGTCDHVVAEKVHKMDLHDVM